MSSSLARSTLLTGMLFSAALFLTSALVTHSQTTVKRAPITSTSPASGEEMYNAYCAVCHGTSGKGNGPAASALKTSPPDLSTLAQSHGGKYPTNYVKAVLRFGQEKVPAHGTKEMPIWGPALASISEDSAASPTMTMRVNNLTQYIGTLQAK